jgi:hypothetical protein
MFALFLLVLLGISALAIDYAGWLLTDRYLQNVADHAALAGASEFRDRQSQGNCTGGLGQQKCIDARAQMWRSLSDELKLGLSATTINCLASVGPGPHPGDSPDAGDTTSARAAGGACTSEAPVDFGHTIWVTTPPPRYAAYTKPGGRFSDNFGVTFTRVDRPVRSFLGGALGIKPDARAGWATAGALPFGFAMQTFCRNNIAPQGGACVNAAGLTIDGQGGIRLVRGDIGSNESLKVTVNGGQGVQLNEGNVFLVNETCQSSTWNCPNGPPSTGGISDGIHTDGTQSYIGKNAFYMAPLPVPHFASPLDGAGDSTYDCRNGSPSNLCVPYQDQADPTPYTPGSWTCLTTGSVNRCGSPTPPDINGNVSCIGQGGGNPPLHYYPTGPSLNGVNADPAHPQSNANKYRNIDDDFILGDPDTAAPPALPANPPTDYLYSDNIRLNGGGPWTASFIVNLGQSGPRLAGISTVRYVGFKTNASATPAGAPDNGGNAVTLQAKLLPASGVIPIAVDPNVYTLTDVPTRFEFTVGAGVIPTNQFNSLRLQFTFSTTGSDTPSNLQRGGGIAWAEIEHPEPQPPLAPMIPPGYYKSIYIPANSCAILDPTAEYSSLQPYQMPGIYRFGGTGNANTRHIQVDSGSYLIGDGVTLVFDPDWPAAGSQTGLALDTNSALLLNTMRLNGTSPPCTPAETETTYVNMSAPLSDLPHSAVCAAWAVDTNVAAGIRPGQNAWPHCDPADLATEPHCVTRSTYNPATNWRGITFYFTPDGDWTKAHASIAIQNRFQLSGDPGLNFRGVLYAPYDNAKISGRSVFHTVGQVLVWSAKFNGGDAGIDLDFPYTPGSAAPYLLEPTVNH